MKRSEGFLVFSILFTSIVFVIFRTPFIIYMGLFYALVFYLNNEGIRERGIETDAQTILGMLLIIIAPLFLFVKIGKYTSPSAFHALFLAGLSLVFFEIEGDRMPLGILTMEWSIALISKTKGFNILVSWLSKRFVDVTSYLVGGLIDIFKVPIFINGNVAVVRDSIIIVGSGCSGLDAFILYLLASTLLIALRKPDKNEAMLLLLGALGIIPLNAVRIFSLLVIGYYSGISFLELFHSHLGDLMFVAYVSLYWWWATGIKKKEDSVPSENYE
ncbi:archaeosortase/exosortase family protein [Thermococcus sp.]